MNSAVLRVETHRLLLRPFEKVDTAQLYKLACHPELAKWTRSFSIPFSWRQAEEWLSRAIAQTESGSGITFAVHMKTNDALIGAISLKISAANEAELGYWLGVEYQGNGYCVEAVGGIFQYAFRRGDIRRIFGRCDSSNQASVNVMLRSGMQPVDDKKEQTLVIKDKQVRLLSYEIRL